MQRQSQCITDGYATIHFSTLRKAEFYKIRNFKVVKEISGQNFSWKR